MAARVLRTAYLGNVQRIYALGAHHAPTPGWRSVLARGTPISRSFAKTRRRSDANAMILAIGSDRLSCHLALLFQRAEAGVVLGSAGLRMYPREPCTADRTTHL